MSVLGRVGSCAHACAETPALRHAEACADTEARWHCRDTDAHELPPTNQPPRQAQTLRRPWQGNGEAAAVLISPWSHARFPELSCAESKGQQANFASSGGSKSVTAGYPAHTARPDARRLGRSQPGPRKGLPTGVPLALALQYTTHALELPITPCVAPPARTPRSSIARWGQDFQKGAAPCNSHGGQ